MKQNIALIKVVSFIIATSLWLIFHEAQFVGKRVDARIHVYNTTPQQTIIVPDTISLYLYGKKYVLDTFLQKKDLVLHMNAETLSDGTHSIIPTPQTLFLPPSVKVVSYQSCSLQMKKEQK